MAVTAESLQSGFASNQPFDTDKVGSFITDRLSKFENGILQNSKRYVELLNAWSQQINSIDSEINEISGSFAKIKSDAGMRVMGPYLTTGSKPDQKASESDIIDDSIIDFPNYPVEINMSALDQVGHNYNDVISGQQLPALITVIPPGQPMPRFWNCSQDYFSPETSTAARASDDQFETSFSLYFNFNPIPLAVLEMRKAGK